MRGTREQSDYVQTAGDLSQLGTISGAYQHHAKLVSPGEDLILPNAHLKWYEIRRSEAALSEPAMGASRAFVESEAASGRLKIDGQLGFVLHHHCDRVVFLIVTTWCNTNELWKTVYIKEPAESSFRLFEARDHQPAFCVWELGAVWHEQQAWVRYLFSKRDSEAKYAYLNDRFSGLV